MLVVMLILMVATAAAAMSVQATQYELQAAGHERQALQTRYLAETSLMTAAVWFDKVFDPDTGGGFGTFYENCAGRTPPPRMWQYGQPEVDTATHAACRINWLGMRAIDPLATGEVAPVSQPVALQEVGETTPDFLGSLGPRQAYQPEPSSDPNESTDFIVDLVCRPEVVEAGTVVAGGTTTTRTRRYYCVVTARARTLLPGVTAGADTKNWALEAGTFQQNPFSTYHEMRMTLLTPEEVF